MNSKNNENINDVSETGSSNRIRTESECSTTSDDGNNTAPGKRQRTMSQQFLVASGLTAASPPRFVSLEEIIKAANGMRDMALVHQIAVDKDFRLEPVEPQNNVQKVVKDTLHRAFWDVLKEQLAENPPNYKQALMLLENIKEGIFVVLLPQHMKIQQEITEVLDTELIKQQAEQGILDFKHYAQYIISVMAKLCAPVRDERIKQLSETVDVIETFKGILEVLDLMALDMANYTMEIVKPDIIAHSVQLERNKFADYLAIQPDGLEHTRNWLLKHLDTNESASSNSDPETYIRNLTKKVFSEACIDLLEWDNKNSYPETFVLDEARLSALELALNRTIVVGTILLVTGSYVGPDLQTITSFKNTIKDHSSILLQSVNSEKELKTILENVGVQVINDVRDAQEAHGLIELSEEAEKLLKEQILDISKPDHRIRQLVRQRVKDFLLQIIQSSTAAPQKVPSGLTSLQNELTTIAGQFLRIVSHNSTVFSIYYTDIISKAMPITA